MDHDLRPGCPIGMSVSQSTAEAVQPILHGRMTLHEIGTDDGEGFIVLEGIDIFIGKPLPR